MPIGVPKVTYQRRRRGRRYEWIDVYTRLAQDRVLFITGAIEPGLTQKTLALILFLTAENAKADISLYVNRWGGSISNGLAISDAVQNITSSSSNKLETINFGIAASIPAFVVRCGTKGKRFALPHARFLISPKKITNEGPALEIFTELEEMARTRQVITKLYSIFTGQSEDQLLIDLDRDDFISATKSIHYGLIDCIRRNR